MASATKYRRLTHAELDRKFEAEKASLRRRLSRLVTKNTKPGGSTYDYKPRLTFRMFCIMLRIDEAMIGTPDYMGLAYWWDGEYKHTLRDASPKQRKIAHDRILAAGLRLDDVGSEHESIIERATRPAKKAKGA